MRCVHIYVLIDAVNWPMHHAGGCFRSERARRMIKTRGGGLSPMMEAAE